MFKKILTFSLAVLLAACAGGKVKESSLPALEFKKVDYFVQGRTQAAFKVVGQMDDAYLEGVLRIKKIGEEDFDVLLMTGAAYRVMHAVVSPEGVAYRYLFKDADTAVVRGRISQFLNLLVALPGKFQRRRVKNDTTTLIYQREDAQTRLMYRGEEIYPYAAQSSALLNTSDLSYLEYAPAGAGEGEQVPHQLVYKDGKITLDLTLVSLR